MFIKINRLFELCILILWLLIFSHPRIETYHGKVMNILYRLLVINRLLISTFTWVCMTYIHSETINRTNWFFSRKERCYFRFSGLDQLSILHAWKMPLQYFKILEKFTVKQGSNHCIWIHLIFSYGWHLKAMDDISKSLVEWQIYVSNIFVNYFIFFKVIEGHFLRKFHLTI